VRASLRRLQTDYVDLYYLHGPDPVTPLDETLRAYDDLVRQGKARYVGVSNLFGWQIATATGITRRLDLAPLAAGQYIYSPIHRELEQEVIPAAVAGGSASPATASSAPTPRREVQGTGRSSQGNAECSDGCRWMGRASGIPTGTGRRRPSRPFRSGRASPWPPRHRLAAGAEVRQRRRHRRQHARADARKPGGSRLVDAAGGLGRHRDGDSAVRRQPHMVQRQNYQRVFAAAEFHDERVDLL